MKKSKTKDVVFLCQYFYPEFLSSARLPFDIAKNLVENGYSVGALCGYPKEYSYQYECPKREIIDGVRIRRVKYSHRNRHKFFGRVLNTFTFTANSFMHLGLLRKYKCAVVISDPPILPVVGVAAKKLFKTKMVFISYDIFPEIAISTKRIRENGLFSKYMNWLNRRFQKTVDKVVALTDEMKQYIVTKRPAIKPEQVYVIPNWATESIKRNPTPENFEKMGFEEDQFVVAYFGNLGICQDMETFLGAAKELKDDKNIQFLIAGHGNKILPTLKFINENSLDNIQLWEFLEGKAFEAAVSVSSACVVSLEKGLKGTCAPSKYYSYLRIGSPVISIGETDSYLSKEVVEEKIGCCVEVGDVKALVENIKKMAADPEETAKMGERARQLYISKYDKKISLAKYKKVIGSALEEE